jgi:predicted enzyme related to lactoylglutathione lyase
MPNPICHFEIGCRDRDTTGAFYAKMFDWTLRPDPHATAIKTGGDIGGHITALGHEPHNYTLVYVMVDNVAAALAKAESLGGKKLMGPQPLPNNTEFGWFSDPEGNMIGVYAEAKK